MQVYKAIKGGITEVAVKVMGHAGTGGTARQAERLLQDQEAFRREILLLKSCRDRHIVQFLGACLQVCEEAVDPALQTGTARGCVGWRLGEASCQSFTVNRHVRVRPAGGCCADLPACEHTHSQASSETSTSSAQHDMRSLCTRPCPAQPACQPARCSRPGSPPPRPRSPPNWSLQAPPLSQTMHGHSSLTPAPLQPPRLMLVTEYMAGGDLFTALARDRAEPRKFSWSRGPLGQDPSQPARINGLNKRIALDLARGVAFLHSRRTVHFDVKVLRTLPPKPYPHP